jgi:hypothetical protein
MRLRTSAAVVVALSLVAAARPAVAGPDEPTASERAIEEARARFQKGVQLFREASFESALAEFRRAYQLAPSYRLLYNIAQVQYELHDHVEALKAFRQYLAEGGSEIAADRRAQVEADILKLEGRVASVEISTNVEGAQVLIDDVPVGTSPLKGPVLVNSGPRRISVSKAGYGTTARNVTVAGGDRVKISLDASDSGSSRSLDMSVKRSSGPSKDSVASAPNRTAMWVGIGTTAAFAVGTGAFALLAKDAKSDFDRELTRFPTTKARIDDARSRMKTYAAITDGLGAATIVSGAVTAVIVLSSGGTKSGPQQGTETIHIAPRLGGVTVSGSF